MALYKDKSTDLKDWKAKIALWKENEAELDRIDWEAKQKGELLWRYIREPFADGYAIYQIVKVNKNSVRIRHCTGFGDDWMIPYWGEEATIDMEYALMSISNRDMLDSFFASKT